jgi:two-component system, NtrC family, response regulator PilR
MSAQTSPTILVVDDEPDLLMLIELTLTKLGFNVRKAESVAQAKAALTERTFDLCLTDMRLKDGLGLEVLQFIQDRKMDIPTAVLTAYGNADNAVAALKAGAFDYLAKPVSIEQLRALVKSALSVPKTVSTTTQTAPQVLAPNAPALAAGHGGGSKRTLLGSSASIEKLRELLQRLALSMAPVHVHGESGTGKELAARILHEHGPRGGGPFVAVNCGAIPETLMETEFFGAKKGAFTGANDDRIGFFQAANGGTLFLDEVADLPLSMQVKLLRVIQEKNVRKVGATAEEAVDVRIVSATHKSLADLVANGTFRQDLFYRLSVIPVTMPSLRDIRDDVGVIAQAVLARVTKAQQATLTSAAITALSGYDFPGNVRELENILERAVALAANPNLIDAADLFLAPPDLSETEDTALETTIPAAQSAGAEPAAPTRGAMALQEYLDTVEKHVLLQAIAECGGNRTKAARLLGITFRSIRYRLERLGLDLD